MLPPKDRTPIVVVAENEPAIRALLTRSLTEERFSVLAEKDATAALSYFRLDPQPIALLIADVGMPRMEGLKLAQQVQSLSPQTRVLLITGHGGAALRRTLRDSGLPFLLKPFTQRQLLGR